MSGASPSANTLKRSKMASSQETNLNHLLNFTLPPRQSRPLTNLPRRSRKTGNIHGVWNKERFVNAQYRFVMNPTGDYTVHFADPDMHKYSWMVFSYFQWHDIMQVIVPRASALAHAVATGDTPAQDGGIISCPICLSVPTAPRMTKCGHVYCYPCILRHLSMSDNKWARCPICFDSVTVRQLKCVKWFEGPVLEDNQSEQPLLSLASTNPDTLHITPRPGSTMRMRLMQRPQLTTLALPRSHTWPSDLLPSQQAPFHFLPDIFAFSKFMLATPAHLISDLTQELNDLAAERRVLAGMTDTLSVSFIDGADQMIRQEIAKVAALDTPHLRERIEKTKRDQLEIERRFAIESHRSLNESRPLVDEVPEEFLALKLRGTSIPAQSDHSAKGASNSLPGPRSVPRQRKNLNPPPPSTSTYYFYQADSGLPIFLHPLDIKILLSNFNSYSAFPDNILIRIEAYSEGTVNDDLRKRCKYLAHMPEGADVVFIEADLQGVVGEEGLKNFEHALKMRSARRKEKVRKDDRAKARAEEREREKERRNAVGWRSSEPSRISPDDPLHSENVEGVIESLSQLTPYSSAQNQQQYSQQTVGAWGNRSFASALHSPAPQTRTASQRAGASTDGREVDDAWDIDIAWHELERTLHTGGRKKRNAKLLVLGSGGSGHGRRH
ncbi:hypothetical protein AMATHDRAFT_140553 [Amanita thiersii Skay4041]|uniref:RING-type domain-containing protein n=1 Tax=Amanita thiersii Skay4041 TaxID=703135 RepID=A0A2A9NWW4_9AGAR|nr:hypothetical protein AMATHDRAFT_140553 [Amanita thiersii Skay4041]